MNDTKKTIGSRINTALELRGMKQKELAKILGVTDNTVSYYVSGARTPNAEQIIAISTALGVSTDYILGVSTITDIKDFDSWTDDFKSFIDLSRQNFSLYFSLLRLVDTILDCNNLTNEQKELVCDKTRNIIFKLQYYIENINILASDIDKYIDAYCEFYTNHKIINKNKTWRPYTKNHAIVAITEDYLGSRNLPGFDEFGGFNYILCDRKTLDKDLFRRCERANDNEEE